MKRWLPIVFALFFLAGCKTGPKQQENREFTLPRYFYKHLKGTYFNMPAVINITRIDTLAYITLIYGSDYRSLVAVVDDFKNKSFTYHLVNNLRSKDTVETWYGKFVNDSTLELNVKIPIRDTTFRFVETYENAARVNVQVFDTTVYYDDTDQELFLYQVNSLNVPGLDFDFLLTLDDLKKQFENSLKSVNDYIKYYNPESANYFYPFYYNTITTVEYNDNNLLVIGENSYQYTGGAHGFENIRYYNIDLQQKRLIRLNEIVRDTVALKKLTYERLVAQDVDLFVDENSMPLPDFFYIIGAKLVVGYNVYTIAPYVTGSLTVEYSFKEIKPLINPDFVKHYFPGLKKF